MKKPKTNDPKSLVSGVIHCHVSFHPENVVT